MSNLPAEINIKNLIDDLRYISWKASDILLYYLQKIKDQKYNSEFIKTKNNNEPVTMADLEVNKLIIDQITKRYSLILGDVLSEEKVKSLYEHNNKFLWVLDPLDGTKDFIQCTENFAMHLALNFKNRPFIGVVLIPMRNELWIADGNQVWCEDKDGTRKEVKFSNNFSLKDMTIVTSKNHSNKNLQDLIDKLGFKKSLVMGSIGCKIASIVRGESDIYISLSLPGKSAPKDWDFAAPEIILRQAGGAITNLYNEELSYNNQNYRQEGIIIASNNIKNHKIICLEIQKVVQKYNIFPLRTN